MPFHARRRGCAGSVRRRRWNCKRIDCSPLPPRVELDEPVTGAHSGRRLLEFLERLHDMETSTTQHLQSILDRLNAGDDAARDEMINAACARLTVLTRKMFRDFPKLRQWEQTEDVSQNASMRLRRAMESVTPQSVREFFGLAAVQIRRELLDMTRSVYGRKRPSANDGQTGDAGPQSRRPLVQPGGFAGGDDSTMPTPDVGEVTNDPDKISAWTEFHEHVEQLPDNLREVTDLLFYQELTQQEAAELLGVDASTVKRRWRDARLKLHDALKGWLPGV